MHDMNSKTPADISAIECFLKALHQHALSLITDEVKGSQVGLGFAIRNGKIWYNAKLPLNATNTTINRLAHFLATASNQTHTVYFRNCVGPMQKLPYEWGDADVIAPLAVVFDRDGDHRGKAGIAFPLQPSLLVQTSNGSTHEHFMFSEGVTREAFKQLTEGISALLQIDAGSSTPSHLYRVPGTVNYPKPEKAAAGRVPELVIWKDAQAELRKYSPAELATAIAQVRTGSKGSKSQSLSQRALLGVKKPPADRANLPAHIRTELDDTWVEGQRSDRNMKVIADLYHQGFREEDIIALAIEHPHSLGAKMDQKGERWMVGEIQRIIKKVEGDLAKGFNNDPKLMPRAKVNLHAIHDLMTKNDDWRGVFRLNIFTGQIEQAKPLPILDGLNSNEPFTPHVLKDIDENRTLLAIQMTPGFARAGPDPVLRAIGIVAKKNQFHPVREYIQSQKWDGIRRLSHWLEKLGGKVVEPANQEHGRAEIYLAAVARLILVSVVARVFVPGCKADSVAVFEGPQGIGKSRLIRALCPDPEWFSDCLPGDLQQKDARLHLQGKLIVEMAELASINRSTIEATKAFLTTQTDQYRPPYMRHDISWPRQCIFIATTNSYDWGRDDTGNRRFLPVRFEGDLDVKYVIDNRDQLFAEAYEAYKQDEPLFLQGEALAIAQLEQVARQSEDPLSGSILKAHEGVRKKVPPTIEAIMRETMRKDPYATGLKTNKGEQMRVAGILRLAGFLAMRRSINGKSMNVWWRDDLGAMPTTEWEAELNKPDPGPSDFTKD